METNLLSIALLVGITRIYSMKIGRFLERKPILVVTIFCLISVFVWAIWPVRALVWGVFSRAETLIVFTNEAEARPCGGFITAYGNWRWWPTSLSLKNVYHLDFLSLGENEYPLSEISRERRFWDLGDTADLDRCTRQVAFAYSEATGFLPKQVILVDIGTIEDMIDRLGGLEVDGWYIDSDNFFGFLTRSVADVDRHDEESLQNRKAPLASLGKKIIGKALFRPWEWRSLSQDLRTSLDRGDVFVETTSPDIKPEASDFVLTEWNLGGGKSSRFLQKKLEVHAYESGPDVWEFKVKVRLTHMGGYDEPLSQNWRGLMTLQVPDFLNQNQAEWRLELSPGDSAVRDFVFDYEGKIPKNGSLTELSFFRPRGQDYTVDLIVSLFPQQGFVRHNFPVQENVGQYSTRFGSFRERAFWEPALDKSPPFLTLHTVIAYDNLPPEIRRQFEPQNPGDIWAEVHFNEKVKITDGFVADLKDRNYSVSEQTNDPSIAKYVLLEDQRTLVLHFPSEIFQQDERYYLTLAGVEDLHGNMIQAVPRTLITR